jgi:hypothetical protein
VGSTTSKIAVIAALSTLWPTIASPQQGGAGTGGLQVDLGVDTSVKYDDNFDLTPGTSPGDSYISDTKLTFGLTSSNSAYDFGLNATGVLRFADLPTGSQTGFEDPTVRFNFTADSVDSRLSLTGRYRNVDRDFIDPFQIEQEEQQFGALVGDGGTLVQTTLGLKYQFGLTAPLGFDIDLRHDDSDYRNVVNPQLIPARTDSIRGTVNLRFSQVATGRVFAGVRYYEAEDAVQTDRTTQDFGIGVSYDINPVLKLDADIGQTNVETERTTGITETDGLSGAVTLTKDVTNGTVFGTVDSIIDQNGQRTSLTFGRDLNLPNGSLRGVLGVTDGDTGGGSWIGKLRYDHKLRSSSVTLSLDRGVSTNSLDQSIVDTRLALSYNYDINNNSRIRLGIDYGRREDLGTTGAPTVELTNFRASYSHDVTQDWAMTGGLVLRSRKETGLQDAESTAVFLSLDRTFSFRP